MMLYDQTSHAFTIVEVKAAGQGFAPFLLCNSSVLVVTASSSSFLVPEINSRVLVSGELLNTEFRGVTGVCGSSQWTTDH